MLGIAGGWPLSVSADNDDDDNKEGDDNPFRQQLVAAFSSADALALKQLMGTLVADPALPALAASVLQANSSNLTGFQASLLGAVPIATRSPLLLKTILSGSRLTPAQHEERESISEDLRKNPAMQTILRTAKKLKTNPTLLQTYVNALLGGSTTPGFPTALGDPKISAIAQGVFNAGVSNAFTNVSAAALPLMHDTNFVRFLRHQHPIVLANFIPGPILISLMLPNDVDPPLSPATMTILEILALLLGFAFAVLTTTAPAIIMGLLVLSTILYLFLLLSRLYGELDCDRDGDPSDAADVPGNECP